MRKETVTKQTICNTETSIKDETEKNNTAENKITDEQVIEGSHKKKNNRPVQRKIVLK